MHFTKFASIVAVLASAITYVGGSVAITAPQQASWKAGTKNIITWQDNNNGIPMPAKHDIALMQGKETSLALIATISNGVDSSLGQYQWEIPATQAPGKDYAIRIGTSSNVTYSPHFEILAADGSSGSGSGSQTSSPAGGSGTSKSVGSVNVVTKSSILIFVGCMALQLL